MGQIPTDPRCVKCGKLIGSQRCIRNDKWEFWHKSCKEKEIQQEQNKTRA